MTSTLTLIYDLDFYPRRAVACSVPFFGPSSIRELATSWPYFLRLSLYSVILIDSSTGSPVHVLMLSIQAVRGLPRLLRSSGIKSDLTFQIETNTETRFSRTGPRLRANS